MMKNHIQKLKTWANEHREGLVVAGSVAGVAALYAVLFVVAVKVNERMAEEAETHRQELKNDFAKHGGSLLTLGDGSLMAVPNNYIQALEV